MIIIIEKGNINQNLFGKVLNILLLIEHVLDVQPVVFPRITDVTFIILHVLN